MRAGEALTALLLALNIFCLLAAYYLLKTIREPLILTTPGGAEVKSYAAAAIAILLIVLVPLYGAVASRVSRVRLINGVTLILEIKGYEDDQTRAKHAAARRWVSAVNNWGQLGRWAFHVCRKPQSLARELAEVLQALNADNAEKLVELAAASLEAPCDAGLFAAK